MRVVATRSLEPGSVLAKTIYNENGQALLHQGVSFTEKVINRLKAYDITYVYIEDGRTEDVIAHSPISEQMRMKAIKSIKQTFSAANHSFTTKSYMLERSGTEMRGVVRSLMEELRNHKEVVSLLSDVFTFDDYIFTHSLNVTMYALALGKELRLSTVQLEELGLGSILHDVGKISVPREILQKRGKLTEEEFEWIKIHSEAGFEMLRQSPNIPLLAAHCAYQHHERLDGSGYPRGIYGQDIHLFGKILAIADVFDAVTSNRVYREAMLPHEGLEILYSGAGTLFDKDMVEAFRRCIAVYPNGLSVRLGDGRKGIVVKQHPHLCDRPTVRIINDDRTIGQDLDLSKELNIMVTNCHTTSVS
ncbi:HD-GYP domain, c-di-GMP phosphodiesterase class II (or its inactivated variant) [Halobacillus dabanensis]|uniref:HD-GYP domain, c-di-GMP phosphodiesterase class II (Or its inactivated variant) n=1 Tax=Halobacillus dabanensis TaxID=240302 RepID=A0A1I3R522_HALDA|nr:HD domain-containing phosphohydrolase [Halobacillus dabanensis]SFJ41205.1 HD-GYP domain, c-di-GMP phosphodiesterase class II (or its inactivated variant) [Halobacillus dabanensis]